MRRERPLPESVRLRTIIGTIARVIRGMSGYLGTPPGCSRFPRLARRGAWIGLSQVPNAIRL